MLLLHQIIKLIMTIDDKIRDEKLQYNTNRKEQKHQHYHLQKLVRQKTKYSCFQKYG